MTKYMVQIPDYGWRSENLAPQGGGQMQMEYPATVARQELDNGQALVVPLRKYPKGVTIDDADREGPVIEDAEGEMIARVNPADIRLFC